MLCQMYIATDGVDRQPAPRDSIVCMTIYDSRLVRKAVIPLTRMYIVTMIVMYIFTRVINMGRYTHWGLQSCLLFHYTLNTWVGAHIGGCKVVFFFTIH